MFFATQPDKNSGQVGCWLSWTGVSEPDLHSASFARRLALGRCTGIRFGQCLPCASWSGVRGEGPAARVVAGCPSSLREPVSCQTAPAANAIGAAFQIDHFGGSASLDRAAGFAPYPIESLADRGALFSDAKRCPHVHSTWDSLVLSAGFLSKDASSKLALTSRR